MLPSSRIIRVGETPYAHEREALAFIEGVLPNTEPFHVWELFEFLDPATGRLLEVDALVLGYSALYLVEIKSGPGKYEGNTIDWYRTPPGEPSRYMTPPLSFTNLKAKTLKSRLEARLPGQRLPRIEPLVFLSAESVELRFEQHGDIGVVTRRNFVRAVQYHQFPGAPSDRSGRPIAAPMAHSIAVTLRDKLGIRPRQGKLHVNEWQLGPVLHDTDVYQDREAEHRDRASWKARARVYLVPQQTTVEHRQNVRRAADREAALLYELRDHPNILRTTGYATDAEVGPTVIFDHFDGEPLHAFLRKHPDLSFEDRACIVGQVGHALAYCHQKHIAHGAVSPYAVLVRRDPAQGIQTKLFNFQLGRGDGVQSTSHVTAFLEPPWRVYQAPELDEEGQQQDEQSRNRRGPGADLFGLGALAYFAFTGQHPAATRTELLERLKREQSLDPRSVDDGVPANIAELIVQATAASAVYRGDDLREWVDLLLEHATAPESEESTPEVVPPHEARRGDRLTDDLEVIKLLGHGATSRVLRVKRRSDGRELALKCSISEDHDPRLAAEGKLLEGLVHQNIVQRVGDPLVLGGRTCLLLTLAGSETLHAALARDGIVSLDYASRYGEELLLALEFLEDRGILHRDIKPANLGVGSAGKDKKHLTLFDFSLASVSITDIEVGTSAYREPFLRERGAWDAAADRWSAAVTLHELLTAARPGFPDGKTALDPDAEIQVLAERFDPAVRSVLAAFFQRAFQRAPEQRFASAYDMRRAWLLCFEEERKSQRPVADEPAEAESPSDLSNVTPETPVAALALSARARAALDRAGILYTSGLLSLPENSLSAIRGVGREVAKDILRFRDRLRQSIQPSPAASAPFFPDYQGHDVLVRTTELPEAVAVGLEDAGLRTLGKAAAAPAVQVEEILRRAGASPETLRDYLTRSQERGTGQERPSTLALWLEALLPRKPDRAKYFVLLFGLAPPFAGRLDVRAVEVAKALGVSRARVYQALDLARDDWEKHATISQLRAAARAALESLGGFGPLREIASVFAQRFAPDASADDALTVARAAALLRIVAEVERSDASGIRQERLHNDDLWLSAGPDIRPVVETLGALADDVAAAPVLVSPGEIQRRLSGVIAGSPLERLTADRVVQLAALASQKAACSPRLELYPRGMDAPRALELSSSVLSAGMSAEQVQKLVSARYPDSAPLPPRPELDELLARHELHFSSVHGTYQRPHERVGAQSTSFEPIGPVFDTATTSQPRAMNPSAIAARELDEQINHALDRKLVRVLAVNVADAHDVASRLLERKPLRQVRLDEALIEQMKALMTAKSVAPRVVHETDRLGRSNSNKGWNNLTALARGAADRVIQNLLPPLAGPLLLTQPGLLARYELTGLLQAVIRATAAPEAHAIFLLVPTHERSGVPRIEGTLPIPGVLPSQVLWITRDWLENRHGAAA